jgi:hypothetical protein
VTSTGIKSELLPWFLCFSAFSWSVKHHDEVVLTQNLENVKVGNSYLEDLCRINSEEAGENAKVFHMMN